jgi:hypothetical protein
MPGHAGAARLLQIIELAMIDTAPALRDGQTTLKRNSALAKASLLYREVGLRLPPVPLELAERLLEQAEWRFGTDPAVLTDRDGFLAAARDPATPAQIGFGHVGDGITSWWLCYRLIRGALAVYLRHSFGGVYNDHKASVGIINPTVGQVEQLVVVADADSRSGRIAPGQRLVLVIDDLGGSGWEIAGGSNGWHDSNQPIDDVMALLIGD